MGEKRKKMMTKYIPIPESKFIVTNNRPSLATTITVTDLINMGRGTDNQAGRIGDKILVKSILSRFYVSQPIANTLGQTIVVRAMLVYDRQSNGVTIDTAKLLQTDNDVLSALNSDNAGRYKIIWDKVFNNVSQTNNNAAVLTENVRFKTGLPVHYNATAGNITDVQRGNIAFLIWYENANTIAVSGAPLFDAMFKISYVDN